MNLKNLSNEDLFQGTELLVKKERETLTQLLYHFKEIDRRKLYTTIQIGSLYDYLMIKLGYPKDQAWRRVQAMNLLNEIPEIEEKITSGSLSLSHMGMAQSFFKRRSKELKKPYSKAQKLEVLEKFENTSAREAEKLVIELHGDTPMPYRDVIKSYSKDLTELKCAVQNDTVQKIEQLKGLMAHKNPNMKLGELIDQLVDLGIQKWSPANQNNAALLATSRVAVRNESLSDETSKMVSQASIRRQVWREAFGRCQNCNSTYALEIDHFKPKSLGGDSSRENLRLLCRACNQRAAIEAFGIAKMERYLARNM